MRAQESTSTGNGGEGGEHGVAEKELRQGCLRGHVEVVVWDGPKRTRGKQVWQCNAQPPPHTVRWQLGIASSEGSRRSRQKGMTEE